MQHTLPIKYDDIYIHIIVDGTNLNLRKLQKLRRSDIYIYRYSCCTKRNTVLLSRMINACNFAILEKEVDMAERMFDGEH